jgi:hypothetical protein
MLWSAVDVLPEMRELGLVVGQHDAVPRLARAKMLERFIDLRHRVCLGYRRDRMSRAEIEHLVDDDRTAGWIATDLLLTQEKWKNGDFQRLGYETYLLKKPLRPKYL